MAWKEQEKEERNELWWMGEMEGRKKVSWFAVMQYLRCVWKRKRRHFESESLTQITIWFTFSHSHSFSSLSFSLRVSHSPFAKFFLHSYSSNWNPFPEKQKIIFFQADYFSELFWKENLAINFFLIILIKKYFSDPCDGYECPFGGVCITVPPVSETEPASRSCRCPETCSESSLLGLGSKAVVCGTDDQTYSNECELHIASCKLQVQLYVRHLGNCKGIKLTFILFINFYLLVRVN